MGLNLLLQGIAFVKENFSSFAAMVVVTLIEVLKVFGPELHAETLATVTRTGFHMVDGHYFYGEHNVLIALQILLAVMSCIGIILAAISKMIDHFHKKFKERKRQ